MHVGTAVVDITPHVGCELSGYVARVQPSVGLHTRLLARALYLESAGRRLLWLHAELIGFERTFVVALKQTLFGEMGLSAHDIVISATHTHAGPCTLHLNQCGDYDGAYVARLRGKLLEAARRAASETEPVTLVFSEANCDLAIDRRGKASAHTDPRVGVLGWRRRDGSYAAVWANYAVHNVALSSDNRHISSDLFGAAASRIETVLPGHPTVLFTNGACGNLNPPHHTEDFGQLGAWGDELAQSVLTALDQALPCDSCIQSESDIVDVPLDTGGTGSVERWSRALCESVSGMTDYTGDRVRLAAARWAEEMVARQRSDDAPESVNMELQAARIGAVCLICMGAEVFSSMAEDLRVSLGKSTYLVGYANGDIGYLPSAEAYAEGGYEVDSAFIFYNSFRPRPEAYALVRDWAVALLSRLEE